MMGVRGLIKVPNASIVRTRLRFASVDIALCNEVGVRGRNGVASRGSTGAEAYCFFFPRKFAKTGDFSGAAFSGISISCREL